MEQIKRSKKAGFPAFYQMARWDLRAFKAQMMLMASGSDKSGLLMVSCSRFQKVSFKAASGVDTPRSGMHKKLPWV